MYDDLRQFFSLYQSPWQLPPDHASDAVDGCIMNHADWIRVLYVTSFPNISTFYRVAHLFAIELYFTFLKGINFLFTD